MKLISQENSPSNLILFVYGTLLSGAHRNGTLKNSEFIDHAHTSEEYLMQDSGFPMVFEPESIALPSTHHCGQIKGEMYHIDSQTQTRLDQIEGVPNLYFRKDIVCIDSKGYKNYPYMYITQPVHFNHTKLFTVNEQGFHDWTQKEQT